MRLKPLLYPHAARSGNIFLALFKNEPLQKEELFSHLPSDTQKTLAAFARQEFKGEEVEVKMLWLPEGAPQRIVLFGLGERAKWNERKIPLLPRRMAQFAKREKLPGFTAPLYQAKLGIKTPQEAARVLAANALLADFEFHLYKELPQEGWPEIKTVYLAAGQREFSEIESGLKEGVIIGEETNYCRTLANTPGGDMTPRKLAQAAVEEGKKASISVRVLDEKEMKRLGMGGILGVARGSDEKPKFIILEYRKGAKMQRPLVLVGKGVTFDTGGLNLKPEQAIQEMHMDMSGGAAVIHGMGAIARLKLPVNIVGLIPAVENMPSGSSYRPGDLLKSMSGKTIEVVNTDAEGRIILADALWYGATKYKPELIVDFATLTGAAHVALGKFTSALFTNRPRLTESLVEIGEKSGDYVWPLPLWDEYLENIKGTFGDWANVGKQGSGGGAISGAKFLEQFVNGERWAHIDIAPRMTALESEYLAKGASGVGVRYIVELAKENPKILSGL